MADAKPEPLTEFNGLGILESKPAINIGDNLGTINFVVDNRACGRVKVDATFDPAAPDPDNPDADELPPEVRQVSLWRSDDDSVSWQAGQPEDEWVKKTANRVVGLIVHSSLKQD
jgi:hypothetical protein